MNDSCHLAIERARLADHVVLTEISFAAKKHWKYPVEYFERWHNELTITEEYISRNIVFAATSGRVMVGFYSIVENPSEFQTGEVLVPKGWWLDHMFILPAHHNAGIGRKMIDHARQYARGRGIDRLLVFVDPFARGFYEKVGAEFLYTSKSSIPGRNIPVYAINVLD